MKAVNVTASASSSGDVECYVTGSLTAKASSSGEVAYKGNPKNIDFSPKRGVHEFLMLQCANMLMCQLPCGIQHSQLAH